MPEALVLYILPFLYYNVKTNPPTYKITNLTRKLLFLRRKAVVGNHDRLFKAYSILNAKWLSYNLRSSGT